MLLFGKILLTFALVFFAIKIFIYKAIKRVLLISKIKKKGAKVAGKILACKSFRDLDGLRINIYQIEYSIDNKIYQLEHEYSSESTPQIGSYVEVYYNPLKPEESFIYKSKSLLILYSQIIFIVLVITFIIATLYLNNQVDTNKSIIYP